jgi:4-amino-4-deoxy-L-arabinose transferase-like glycosyltransferase
MVLGALLVVFCVAWLLHLNSVALSLPMDNIEQTIWSASFEWGYYKHPPLPTWLMLGPTWGWGPSGTTTTLLGAACTLASVLVLHQLLQTLWGRSSACIGMLAALCITFYNGRLNYYNHNTVLTLMVAFSAWCWWKILTTRAWAWWMGLGVAAGLGMLSKYQYVLVLGPSVVFFWRFQLWRDRRQWLGMLLCMVVALVIFSPHLIWLVQQRSADNPIQYAMTTAFAPKHTTIWTPLQHSVMWLGDLLLNRCLPAWIFLVLVRWLQARPRHDKPRSQPQVPPSAMGRDFLVIWGALPPLTMTALGLVWGMDLQLQWGTAFALWCIPVFMWLLQWPRRFGSQPVNPWALVLFLAIQSLMMLESYMTSAQGPHTRPHWRTFDSVTLARELDTSARDAVGGKFTIISGPQNVSGAVALALPDRPKVLIHGDLRVSPWIQPNELFKPGVVELWAPDAGHADTQRLPSGWGWRVHTPAP